MTVSYFVYFLVRYCTFTQRRSRPSFDACEWSVGKERGAHFRDIFGCICNFIIELTRKFGSNDIADGLGGVFSDLEVSV